MAILTREQKSEEIMRLEILLGQMKLVSAPHNKTLPVLRKIQKLRDSL